ncbi:MAG: DNA-directed RNA polymerase subunit beta' [Bradymonadia bacterium]
MTDIYSSSFDRPKDPTCFSAMRISLASPQKILEWSHGEVKKPETINYRTFKPERDGLFCAKIFGPVKDYECNCGKYKRMKHRGVVCEKCGVEVIQSKVRRERLGHISLATPVVHIWFFKSLPSRIGNVLDITQKELEKVLYCVSFIVTNPGSTPLETGEILSEKMYAEYLSEYGPGAFEAKMGAEAIHDLLENVNIDEEAMKLRHEMKEATSDAKRKKIAKRLKVIEAFRNSDNLPEWMILEVLPVIPPDLRPLVPLDGGRFATSDLNDLYRRVINRNNRLRRLIELKAPEIIVRNEKRMLQEAVDALFDNGRRGKTIHGANKRPLKSLSDMLKGKHGRFRQNLLGKRVDYSGRSVIVVGPELRLHQCGLPKKMALELFKPFIFNKLVSRGIVNTIKSAKKMVEMERPEVWDILEEVIKEHPVLLNRAPTLHRLGIQAFEPLLTEGKAIRMHPLVCTAFNADFDGDQMAVHLPLSLEAQMEARVLLLSTNNILSPASGNPIIVPTQDMVLGCYYMTRERPFALGCYREDDEGHPIDGLYANFEEVRMAYDHNKVDLQAQIRVRHHGEFVDTTVGRVLLSEILPPELPFSLVNKTITKKGLGALIDAAYRYAGDKGTVLLADRVRTMGYTQATKAGVSINIHDMIIPEAKATLLAATQKEVDDITAQYNDGLITDKERYNKVVDKWSQVTTRISDAMMKNIKTQQFVDKKTGKVIEGPSFNAVYMMADSGARGSQQQIRQIAGMRGLMAKPSGEIIETPIRANFREGLSVLQYFISTHGARKGLADTALKTANSGYLTRRLVDVAQDTIIFEQDCGTLDGIEMTSLVKDGEVIEDLGDRVLGRVALYDIVDNDGKVIVPANGEIDEAAVDAIRHAALRSVYIRSGLTCQAEHGVCALCYGRDLARGRLVNHGEAVGVIAAQSIGEPGTQLTMRTFHTGGTANIEGAESSYEAKNNGFVKFHMLSCVDALDGTFVVMNRNSEMSIHDPDGRERERYPLRYGARLRVKDGQEVKKGMLLAEWDAFANVMISQEGGIVKFEQIIENRTMREEIDKITGMSRKTIIECKETDLLPRIVVRDASNKKTLAEYQMPVDAILVVNDGDEIRPGATLAKIPHDDTKSGGIVGGLPRVAELFEARKPKELAIISEIEGFVTYGKDTKGKRRIIITPDVGEPKEYLIPKGKYIIVHPGDRVQAGDKLMEGAANPHDILAVNGRKELAKFMVDEIQEIYRTQGVRINDKHIEVIVRQMLRRCKITHVGDSNFLLDEHVDRHMFERINARIIERGGDPAVAEDLLLGITKASLSTESFIAASAFQETTKVLTEASIAGRYDGFYGLKENVIMGRLIPAGTGLMAYRYLDMVVESPKDKE